MSWAIAPPIALYEGPIPTINGFVSKHWFVYWLSWKRSVHYILVSSSLSTKQGIRKPAKLCMKIRKKIKGYFRENERLHMLKRSRLSVWLSPPAFTGVALETKTATMPRWIMSQKLPSTEESVSEGLTSARFSDPLLSEFAWFHSSRARWMFFHGDVFIGCMVPSQITANKFIVLWN